MMAGLLHRVSRIVLYLSEKRFDWTNGVRTSGVVALDRVATLGANAGEGVQYEPVSEKDVTTLIEHVPEPERFTFIDYGSGKGRALLIASRYPFRRVLGVEFARELHEQAEWNIAHFRGRRRSGDVRSVHADATEFDLPDEPLVLYFNNPFRGSVMPRVTRRITASLLQSPRDAYVLCVGKWTQVDGIEAIPGVARLRHEPYFKVYRVSAAALRSTASPP
jgi:hypothetical protein